MPHPSKLPYIQNHIFSYMTGLAVRYNAINLSQGFPNFPPDPLLSTLLTEVISNPDDYTIHQYAPMIGLEALRKEIATHMHQDYQLTIDVDDEISIACGATEVIFGAIAAFVHHNDEVILIEPCYDCYRPAIDIVGGKAVVYKMEAPHFKIDWQAFRKLVTPKTRMICIATPNNPTATIWDETDMLALSNIVADTDIIILSDEVYAPMVFDGLSHLSPLMYESLRPRTIAAYSFGKKYHITGWRLGYAIASPSLMREWRKVHQNLTFSMSHHLQKAMALYMNARYQHNIASLMQQKRDYFINGLQSSPLKILPCSGSYFVVADYTQISQLPDMDFCTQLITEHGVAAIPMSRLYSEGEDNKLIRFCFAKTEATLDVACQKLCAL